MRQSPRLKTRRREIGLNDKELGELSRCRKLWIYETVSVNEAVNLGN